MSISLSLTPIPLKSCCTPSRGEETSPQPTLPSTAVKCKRASDTSCNMMRLEGGSFLMGSEGPEAWPTDGEGPVREVKVQPFYLEACAVTNERFHEFVSATSYITEAERFGWSYVFHRHVSTQNKKTARGIADGAGWWLGVEGAYWRKPEGPGSNVRKRLDHPVVHVSWNDAQSFCAWEGTRLPSEAEWEYAARGGLVQKLYPWGDELVPRGKGGKPEHRCNIWQGKFPELDTGVDGFTSTAPVKTFQPNGFGLYQMSGNVWEWCADWFSPNFHRYSTSENPQGPSSGTHRVVKGGSFLCHESYCNRYRVAARTSNTPDSTTSHTSFRCARDAA